MKQLLQHIEFADLVRRAEGNLSESDKHLAVCPECAGKMKKLENFFAFAEAGKIETVPQATTAHLLNIFQPPKPKEKTSFKQRLRARLTFDDWLPEFAFQERLSFSDTRQMLFRAEDFEIDLRLNFAAGKCQISGQIFPDCAKGEIQISDADFMLKTSLNSYCEFVFPFIAEGIYDFLITLKDRKIELPRVSLVS